MAEAPLLRPRDGRMIAGVCAGVARRLDLDASVIRTLWALSALLAGLGILAYVVLWLVLPEERLLGSPANRNREA